jgi:tetratricopeptide (TPR) repeat protein
LNVLGQHVQHALWPAKLAIVYSHPSGRLDWDALFGAACVIAVGAVALRARRSPAGGLVLALAVALYLPVSTLLPFGRVMSDSYAYLPLAAACIGLALVSLSSFARGVLVLGLCAASLVLVSKTPAEVPRWRGGDDLWAPVIAAQPKSAFVRNLYGDELHFRGQSERAVEVYLEAFQLGYDPDRLLHLGAALSMIERLQEAECVLIEAIVHGPNPGYASFNYGVLLAFHRDYAPKYPGIAKRVLDELDALRSTRKVAWPAALEVGLAVRLARLANVTPEAPHWPRRNCEALRVR